MTVRSWDAGEFPNRKPAINYYRPAGPERGRNRGCEQPPASAGPQL